MSIHAEWDWSGSVCAIHAAVSFVFYYTCTDRLMWCAKTLVSRQIPPCLSPHSYPQPVLSLPRFVSNSGHLQWVYHLISLSEGISICALFNDSLWELPQPGMVEWFVMTHTGQSRTLGLYWPLIANRVFSQVDHCDLFRTRLWHWPRILPESQTETSFTELARWGVTKPRLSWSVSTTDRTDKLIMAQHNTGYFRFTWKSNNDRTH